MNENVMFVITENDTNQFVNAKVVTIQPDMTFQCFFPSVSVAERFRRETLSDSRGRYFDIREVEIVEFLNNQLTVAYESEEEVSPFY